MNKIMVVLLGVLLISCSTGDSGASLNRELVKIQDEINRTCPVMVDHEARLDNVGALSGNTFQYNYTLINHDANSVSVDYVLSLKPKILMGYKTNPKLKWITKNRVTVIYSYSGRDGQFIGAFGITPEEYESSGTNSIASLPDEYKKTENLQWKPQNKNVNRDNKHDYDLLSILNTRVNLGDDGPYTLDATFPFDYNGDNHLDYLFFVRYGQYGKQMPKLVSGRTEQLIEFNNLGEEVSYWGPRIDVINYTLDGDLYLVFNVFDFGNVGGRIISYLYKYEGNEYVLKFNDKLIENIANEVNYAEKDMLFKHY